MNQAALADQSRGFNVHLPKWALAGMAVVALAGADAAPAIASTPGLTGSAAPGFEAPTNGGLTGTASAGPEAAPSGLTGSYVSTAQEGRNGNNIVCGGVPTKKVLMDLARGGKDSCGNKDIDEIWERWGITEQVASTMVDGEVCATSKGEWISSGREHSPVPSMDSAVVVAYDNGSKNAKSKVQKRDLIAWGKGCYDAWVGERENGKKVAVLKGCGNPEAEEMPPVNHPKPHPKAKQPTAGVNVVKFVKNDQNQKISIPEKIFTVAGTCVGKGNKVISNIVKIGTEKAKLLKGCLPSTAKKTRFATVAELNVPNGFAIESPAGGTQKIKLPKAARKAHGKGFKVMTAKLAKITNKLQPKLNEAPCIASEATPCAAPEAPKGTEPAACVPPGTEFQPCAAPEAPKGTEPAACVPPGTEFQPCAAPTPVAYTIRNSQTGTAVGTIRV